MDILGTLKGLAEDSGFGLFFAEDGWKYLVMLLISFVLLYLGIKKKFEPLLLVGIAFGCLLTNLPGAGMYHEVFFAGGHIHWTLIGGVFPFKKSSANSN